MLSKEKESLTETDKKARESVLEMVSGNLSKN